MNKNTKKENLYLNISRYNMSYILTKTAKKLEKDGYKIILSRFDKKTLINFSIYHYNREYDRKNILEKIEKLSDNQNIYNKPFISYLTSWCSLHLSVIKDNVYYYVQFDDNPFLKPSFNKIKVLENGEYIGSRYINELEKISFINIDNIFCINSKYQLNKMINQFYNNLIDAFKNQPYSQIVSDKIRVKNYYNNSYHYEHKQDTTKHTIYKYC